MKSVKLQSGNIWSGAKGGLAVFTNPTELAKRKGNLRYSWPIEYNGKDYVDAEAAYQDNKYLFPIGDKRRSLMRHILICKLDQHPILWLTIKKSGGIDWLKSCSHKITGRNWWEGDGVKSPFINALIEAYIAVYNSELQTP